MGRKRVGRLLIYLGAAIFLGVLVVQFVLAVRAWGFWGIVAGLLVPVNAVVLPWLLAPILYVGVGAFAVLAIVGSTLAGKCPTGRWRPVGRARVRERGDRLRPPEAGDRVGA
jgi:hypothetical protein